MLKLKQKKKKTHLKDLETGNIQYTDEVLPLVLGVQGLVDTGHQPAEHPSVQALAKGSHGVHHLVLVLALGHPLVTDLHLGLQQGLQQVTSVDTQQEGDLLSLWK